MTPNNVYVKLKHAMRRLTLWLICLYLSWAVASPAHVFAQFAFQVTITSPQSGDAVQGIVPVIVTSTVDGFIAYQLAFSLSESQTETWFLITESKVAVKGDILGEWDTSNLTDGNYQLRLVVQRESENSILIFAERIRVRNYTPVETNTPGPSPTALPGQTSVPTETTMAATPTSLPPNSAELTSSQIGTSFFTGIGAVLLLFLFVGLYSSLKQRSNKHD